MPTTNWNVTTIGGVDYLVIDTAQFRVPLDWDPSSAMFIAVAAPTGGLGNFPTLVKGDTGDTPTFDTINFTALEATDPSPDSATWTETAPDVWRLDLVLHKGPQGDQGDTVLDPADFTNPVAGQMLVVNSNVDGFVLANQTIGDRFVPAQIASTPAGNAAYTLCSVSVPAQGFDWRPEVSGQALVVSTGSPGTWWTPPYYDARVDLIVRLNDELAGPEVGRAFGVAGLTDLTHVLSSGPPPAASANYDRVAAGAAATLYLRAERIAGTQTFTTEADTTRFCVWVRPIPS